MKSLIFSNPSSFPPDELSIRIARSIPWVAALHSGTDGVSGEMVVTIAAKDKGNKISGSTREMMILVVS